MLDISYHMSKNTHNSAIYYKKISTKFLVYYDVGPFSQMNLDYRFLTPLIGQTLQTNYMLDELD